LIALSTALAQTYEQRAHEDGDYPDAVADDDPLGPRTEKVNEPFKRTGSHIGARPLCPGLAICEHHDDLCWSGFRLLDVQLRQLLDASLQVSRADDRVTPVDRLGLVARQLHCYGTWNPGAFEIAKAVMP